MLRWYIPYLKLVQTHTNGLFQINVRFPFTEDTYDWNFTVNNKSQAERNNSTILTVVVTRFFRNWSRWTFFFRNGQIQGIASFKPDACDPNLPFSYILWLPEI